MVHILQKTPFIDLSLHYLQFIIIWSYELFYGEMINNIILFLIYRVALGSTKNADLFLISKTL